MSSKILIDEWIQMLKKGHILTDSKSVKALASIAKHCSQHIMYNVCHMLRKCPRDEEEPHNILKRIKEPDLITPEEDGL